MASLMFVIRVMPRGIARNGLTSVLNSSSTRPARSTRIAAISVTRWPRPGDPPVVSQSTTAYSSDPSAVSSRTGG